jgi:hypothetical protein
MSVLADFAQRLPALQWLNLRQSVDQFSHTMTAQVTCCKLLPFRLHEWEVGDLVIGSHHGASAQILNLLLSYW